MRLIRRSYGYHSAPRTASRRGGGRSMKSLKTRTAPRSTAGGTPAVQPRHWTFGPGRILSAPFPATTAAKREEKNRRGAASQPPPSPQAGPSPSFLLLQVCVTFASSSPSPPHPQPRRARRVASSRGLAAGWPRPPPAPRSRCVGRPPPLAQAQALGTESTGP